MSLELIICEKYTYLVTHLVALNLYIILLKYKYMFFKYVLAMCKIHNCILVNSFGKHDNLLGGNNGILHISLYFISQPLISWGMVKIKEFKGIV